MLVTPFHIFFPPPARTRPIVWARKRKRHRYILIIYFNKITVTFFLVYFFFENFKFLKKYR